MPQVPPPSRFGAGHRDEKQSPQAQVSSQAQFQVAQVQVNALTRALTQAQAPTRAGRTLQPLGTAMIGKSRTLGFNSCGSTQVDEPALSTESQSVESAVSNVIIDEQDSISRIHSILDKYFISQSPQDTITELLKLKDWQSQFVFEALSKSFDKKAPERDALIPLFDSIVCEGLMTKAQLFSGFEQISSMLESLQSDVPQVTQMFGSLLGKCFAKRLLVMDTLLTLAQDSALSESDLCKIAANAITTVDSILGREGLLILYCNSRFRVSEVLKGDQPRIQELETLLRVDWMMEYQKYLAPPFTETDNNRALKWIQENLELSYANESSLLTDTTIRLALAGCQTTEQARQRLTQWCVLLHRVCNSKEQQIEAISAIRRFCIDQNLMTDFNALVTDVYEKMILGEEACCEWCRIEGEAGREAAQHSLDNLLAFFNSAREE
eukprot:c23140_g1_i1.p1 GENE.c23140_g1_i1~~c23140_g1_i1.p1  ORF type:complete len:450 (+),score=118.07 c23140_g1_i1:38-1351(+)